MGRAGEGREGRPYLICLIQDHVADLLQVKRPPLHQIHDTPGRADCDIHPPAESALLRGDRGTSIHTDCLQGCKRANAVA